MASLNSLYLKKETLEKILQVLNKKDEKGIELTILINDESNQYDQNVAAYVSQTKEQRDAKKERFYVGNGRTFWTDGTIKVVQKAEKVEAETVTNSNDEEDDLPF